MDISASSKYDINIQKETYGEVCYYNNCENIGTEEIGVKAGPQVLSLSLCKIHVGEFQEEL